MILEKLQSLIYGSVGRGCVIHITMDTSNFEKIWALILWDIVELSMALEEEFDIRR